MNNKEEITVKKTTTENNPLKQNTSQPQKSSLKKNKLLIILLSILVCVIIVSTILSLIFIGRKKDDTRVIVEIKREIDQIDYYYLTKKQKTDLEYKNKEKLRNLDDEIVKDSNLIITNSLISVNTFDIVKDKEGRNIYKSFIIIKELNLTDENQNEGNLISLNFDELNEKDLDDINNIPLIQVEFYKDGTIINEYVPKNLNESYLNLLEYSKEKLIPLVSESLYKKDNNLRTLENSEEELSYEENKNENSIILKKGLNKQVYDHGNVMKDSINKGNMSTTIVNGIIQKIDLNASVSFTTNDNEENIEKDKTFIQLPYQKISSDFSSNFNFIKSDKNKKITNNFKNLVKKVSLVNKNILDKKNNENEEEEEVKESEENSNLRRLLFSNSIFKTISTESTIFSTYFLGLYYRLYVRTETDLKNGVIYSFLYLQYGGNYLLNSQKDYTNINISELQKKIMNSAIAYKTDTQNYGNNFLNKLKNLKSSIESKLQSINNRIEDINNKKNCTPLEVIDKFENNRMNLEELLKYNIDDSKIKDCQNKINTSDLISQTKSLVKNFKSNIENKFNGQTPSIINYNDPYSIFNDSNINSEKEVSTLTTEAQQYFGAKRNLRNLEINNIEDDELLRDLSQISLASGNPLVSGILQDFDKMSYEYYLFVNYLSRKYSIKSLLRTETYEIPKIDDLSSEDKTKIEKLYSNANSLINYSLAKYNELEEVLKEISNIIKEIFKTTLPNAKLKTYNSILSNWQQIFKGISNNSVQSSLSKKKETMFKDKKGHDYTYDLDFNVEGKINELQLNIKPNIIFYPQDLSITFNIDVDANLDFVIEGFIRPKGVKASFNLKNLTYNFVNVLDFKKFENTYKKKVDFSPFNLNLYVYKQNYFLWWKTSKSTIFNDNVYCSPSPYWYSYSNIENKSQWEKRENNDSNLLTKKEYWIDDNFP